jgi:hypothetical protein
VWERFSNVSLYSTGVFPAPELSLLHGSFLMHSVFSATGKDQQFMAEWYQNNIFLPRGVEVENI